MITQKQIDHADRKGLFHSTMLQNAVLGEHGLKPEERAVPIRNISLIDTFWRDKTQTQRDALGFAIVLLGIVGYFLLGIALGG